MRIPRPVLERVGEDVSRRLSYLDPEGRSLGPRWFVLSINNVCNLHCYMCDVGTKTTDTTFYKNLIGDGTGNMPMSLYERILDEACGLPFRPGISLAYTEPAIHPDVVEMVAATKRRGLRISLTTNGYTLPKLGPRLVEAGLDQLFVSVDGPKDVHDDIRGSTKSFDRIRDGLEIVQRSRRGPSPGVRIGFVFTERSYLLLTEVIEAFAPLGVEAIHATLLNFVHPDAAARHNRRHAGVPATATNISNVDLSAFDFDAFAQEIERAARRARELDVALVLSPELRTADELRSYHLDPHTSVAGEVCRDPWTSVLIQTNGDVIPAHGRCFNLVMGNLNRASFQEIWNGSEFTTFRRELRRAGGRFPACLRCCGVFGRTMPRSFPVERAIQAARDRIIGPEEPSRRRGRLRVL